MYKNYTSISIYSMLVDTVKRVGQVGSIGSWVKTGCRSKRVIFKQVNRIACQTGRVRKFWPVLQCLLSITQRVLGRTRWKIFCAMFMAMRNVETWKLQQWLINHLASSDSHLFGDMQTRLTLYLVLGCLQTY